jgi:large subunit ribosomal protein L24
VPRATTTERATKVPELRSGDRVIVLTGKDAGKQGEVERLVRPDRVVVAGVNIARKHQKPSARQGRNDRQPRVQQGGIIDVARPLHVSNVMVICAECGEPTRIKHQTQENGSRIRVCARCGKGIPTRRGEQ